MFVGQFIVIHKVIRQRFISYSQFFFAEIIGQNFQVTEIIMLAQIPVVIATACKLGTLRHDGNLVPKRKIQNLVYPNGIYWDKAKRCYRTQNRNKFFDILDRYSISYGKEKGTSSDEYVPLCWRRESNPYASRHQILSLACLPISTRPQTFMSSPFKKGLQRYN